MVASAIVIGALLALAQSAGAATPEPLWTRCASDTETDLSCGAPRGVAASPLDGSVLMADQSNKRLLEFNVWGEFQRAIGGGVVLGAAQGTGDINGTANVSSLTTTGGLFEVGRQIEGEGIAPGTKIVAVGAGTITLSQPTTESKVGAHLTLPEGAGNVPTNERQTVSVNPGAAGSFKLTFTTPNPSPTTATSAAIPAAATALQVEEALAALANIGAGNVAVAGPAAGPWTVEFTGTRFADTDVAQLSADSSGLEPAIGTQLSCPSPTAADSTTYQWLRNGVPITAATSSTYTLSAASTTTPATTTGDAGAVIQCQIFKLRSPSENNLEGTGSTQVANPPLVVPPAPATAPPTHPGNLGLPTLSGGASINVPGPSPGARTLTCSPGSWSGSPSFAYAWYRNGALIPGATASTYEIAENSLAARAVFQCVVTATNAGGTLTVVSTKSPTSPAPSPSAPPSNSGPPPVEAMLATTVATNRAGASAAEVCTAIAECRAGVEGEGGGQLSSPGGVAFDSAGEIYVVEVKRHRVQKFDPSGHFLRMWGKGVNSGTSGNPDLCTNAGPPTDVCKAGEEGTGPGQFGAWTILGSYVAVDTNGTPGAADDKVYVGDAGRIQIFNTSGEYQADLPDPEGLLSAKKVSGLAVVPSGNLFALREGTAGLLELNPATGAKVCEATIARPSAIAADTAGNAYAVEGYVAFEGDTPHPKVRKFGPSCAPITEEEATAPFFPTFPFTPGFAESTGIAIGEACWSSPHYDLYLSKAVAAPNGAVERLRPRPRRKPLRHLPAAPSRA